MFGAGLPVCAVRYPCIGELVDEGATGLLFESPRELAGQLQRLLRGAGGGAGGGGGGGGGGEGGGGGQVAGRGEVGYCGELARMRAAVREKHGGWRWHDNWGRVAAPVVAAACGGGRQAAAAAANGGGGGGGGKAHAA